MAEHWIHNKNDKCIKKKKIEGKANRDKLNKEFLSGKDSLNIAKKQEVSKDQIEERERKEGSDFLSREQKKKLEQEKFEEGIEKNKMETAQKMFDQNMKISDICEITELSKIRY